MGFCFLSGCFCRQFWLLLGVFFGGISLLSAGEREAAATVVLYNSNDKSSEKLARYYAEKRGIPGKNLVGLKCAATEDISRAEYIQSIEKPLREIFIKNNWWVVGKAGDGRMEVRATTMRFVAIIRGIPLRIKSDAPGGQQASPMARDEASVDSELAALGVYMPSPAGVINNPYFRRFSGIFDSMMPPGLLLVGRLDAPTESTVRAMIDDALLVEKTGLWGWGYIDGRGTTNPGYKEGDDWLRAAATEMRRKGIPVISDFQERLFPEGFPMTDPAIYYGWYSSSVVGPFARPEFHFVPGAVAAHIFSFSGSSLRKNTWASALLMKGAAATLGNVYEPYLTLTTQVDILQDRLMNGFTLAESAYMGTRVISWMGVVLGDPLYQPYKNWVQTTAASKSIYAKYRNVVIQNGGDVLASAQKLKELARQEKNSTPIEALAWAQLEDKKYADAAFSFAEAAKYKNPAPLDFRITLGRVYALRAQKDFLAARKVVLEATARHSQEPQLGLLKQLMDSLPTP